MGGSAGQCSSADVGRSQQLDQLLRHGGHALCYVVSTNLSYLNKENCNERHHATI